MNSATMENNLPDFIVIDDDCINNMVCQQIISTVVPGGRIMTFTDPEDGLAFLVANYFSPEANDVVVFLDINMPVLSGWDVLDELQKFPVGATTGINIFMLSSSVSLNDKDRADNNPLVSGFIEKPLSVLTVEATLHACAGKQNY